MWVKVRVDGGFLFKEIRQRNPELIDEVKIRLEQELSEKFGAAPMIAPMSAVIIQALEIILSRKTLMT